MPTVAALHQIGREALAQARIDQPGRESRRLLGFVLDLPEGLLPAHDHDPVREDDERRYRSLLERRATGEPMAYLLGRREFFGRDFLVDDRVLIPRPESEHLVELCLGLGLPDGATALDVGTGSGCLAVTLAAERPSWRLFASDVSHGALCVAHRNAVRLGVGARLRLLNADLTAGLELARFDLVVANLPYVEEEILPHLTRDVRDFEPRVALSGGPGGLAMLRRFLDQLTRLPAGAWTVLEFGFGQQDRVASAVADVGAFTEPTVHPDLAGIPRDVVFRRRP